MKVFQEVKTRNIVGLGTVILLVLSLAVSAFAIPKQQVLLSMGKQLTGKCCFMWGESVSVTEPTVVVPVVVTWSADFAENDEFLVGLSLNGGQCTAYGSRVIPWQSVLGGDGYMSTMRQWVLSPKDGLVRGTNTITLCGGGAIANSDTITIGYNTLAVQIGK
jgi:hypothetical protein